MHEKYLDDELYFFGESYRGCWGLCHIVIASYLVLFVEFIKIVLFAIVLGDSDSPTLFYVIILVIAALLACVGLLKDNYIFLWPYLILKLLEAASSFVTAVTIFVFMMAGNESRNFLALTVKSRYESLRYDEAVGVALLFFFFFVLLSALNAVFVQTVFRCQRYIKRKWMAKYLFHRRNHYVSYFGK
uniref:MARVEL domain-containing protein n=1 Tax=Steinernema glaseri TaxID=37863 RepID=A0A1I7YGS0_9BILA